jgi:serpin B
MGRRTLFLVALLAACGATAVALRFWSTPAAEAGNRAGAAAVPATAPMRRVAGGSNALAVDLYHRLAKGDENLVFSPYSTSTALAMTYAGARGETARQMARALHFYLPQETLHPAFHALNQRLTGLGGGGPRPTLQIADSLWVQETRSIKPAYEKLLATNYGAALQRVDLLGAKQQAFDAIDRWTEQHTQGLIRGMTPPEARHAAPPIEVVLVDAIYLKAAWAAPFPEQLTKQGAFTLLDGQRVRVPLMYNPVSSNAGAHSSTYAYIERPIFEAVDLPYSGNQFSMVVLLPRPGKFRAVERALDERQLAQLLALLDEPANQGGQLDVTLPRFRFTSQYSLGETLAALGMKDAFMFGQADFTGMGDADLFVFGVWHKAYIATDEKGTVAAAGTMVGLAGGGAPRVHRFVANRPFLFFIRDRGANAILFMGRVMDPRRK